MREMKASGVQWLGDVPDDWEVKRVGSLFRERKKQVSANDHIALSVTKKGVVPQLDSAAKSDATETRKLIRKGDFVINSRSDRKGSSGLADRDGSCSSIYIVLEPLGITGDFAHQLFRSQAFQEEFYRWGTGIVDDLWSTRYSSMKMISIPVPQTEELASIVAYLDKETSQIDTLISKKEQLIEKLLERRSAFILAIMSKGRGEAGSPFPGPYLNMSPSSWRVVRVGQVAELVNGFPFDSEKFFPEGQMPLVRIRDLLAEDFETFLTSTSDVPSEKYLISDDDLAIGMDGDFNSILWDRGTAAVNQRVCFLRFKTKLEARFASFVIPLALKQINEVTYSTTVKHLSSGQIVKIPIPLPPPSMLSEVVQILESETFQIDTLVEKSRKAIELLKERRQALITQVVTGKIDVRGFAGGNSQ